MTYCSAVWARHSTISTFRRRTAPRAWASSTSWSAISTASGYTNCREHAKNGGKVVATYCVFVPEEFVWAAGGIPVGLCAGAQFSVPLAEEVLPRNTCALIKSSFGFKLGRLCPYVQSSHLIVGETTCDGKKKMFEILAEHQPVYVMEVPNKKTKYGRALWAGEVNEFKGVIEKLTGNKITVENLKEATKKVNDRRRALQRLYNLRKANPVPISGKDALLVTQVSFYDDVTRDTQMINALCDELDERVKAGHGVFPKNAPRILISGSPMAIPNWKLHHLLETAGAAVVCEESCTGTSAFSDLVAENGGTLDEQVNAIADRYMKINCACFTPTTSGRTISSGWPRNTRPTASSTTTCSSARPTPTKPSRSRRRWPRRASRCCASRPTTRTRTPASSGPGSMRSWR